MSGDRPRVADGNEDEIGARRKRIEAERAKRDRETFAIAHGGGDVTRHPLTIFRERGDSRRLGKGVDLVRSTRFLHLGNEIGAPGRIADAQDRKSTRLNSSHLVISYA